MWNWRDKELHPRPLSREERGGRKELTLRVKRQMGKIAVLGIGAEEGVCRPPKNVELIG